MSAEHEDSGDDVFPAEPAVAVPVATKQFLRRQSTIIDDYKSPYVDYLKLVGTPPTFKIVIGMVGLPARGKSFIAKKLAYYLNWCSIPTKVFNLGAYRRRLVSERGTAAFFDPSNQAAAEQRQKMLEVGFRDLHAWLNTSGGVVGILDATNSTIERRQYIIDQCKAMGYNIFFIESICDDEQVISQNIMSVKLGLPEYSKVDADEAIVDFKQRIDCYRRTYVPLSPKPGLDYGFIQVHDLGSYFIATQIHNPMEFRIMKFVMNTHVKFRHIYLSRHGESDFNVQGRIGGDSSLTPRGKQYSAKLREFFINEKKEDIEVWCSSLKRTLQTARGFKHIRSFKALDELDVGDCDGMTYEETQEAFPDFFKMREDNKYETRYPRGESYYDLVHRLEPCILEMERAQNDILIICHQAVARCLLAYFKRMENFQDEIPYLEVPLHTILKITPTAESGGCTVDVYPAGIDAVSTQRPRTNPPTTEPVAGSTIHEHQDE